MRLGSAAATEEYNALLAVERHVAEAFGCHQSSIAPTSIVENLIKMGSHFVACVQQDAHEFLRSFTANMHLTGLRAGGSPHPHSQEHTGMIHGIFGGFLRSRVHCDSCHTTTRYDTFLDLSPPGTTPFWICHLRCTGPSPFPRHFARSRTPMFLMATTNLNVSNAKRKHVPPKDSLSTAHHECCSST